MVIKGMINDGWKEKEQRNTRNSVNNPLARDQFNIDG